MASPNSRKSGLRNPFLAIEELDFSSFIEPYTNFKEDYARSLYAIKKRERVVPYKVTFVDDKSLIFIAFEQNKDKAKGTAVKYFRDNFHPDFMGSDWKKRYNKARAVVVPQFSPYIKTKKIPIPELMTLGISFPCTSCGEQDFKLEDYENKRCFIVEGEGDLNEFTSGFILCYNCYRQYLKNTLNT